MRKRLPAKTIGLLTAATFSVLALVVYMVARPNLNEAESAKSPSPPEHSLYKASIGPKEDKTHATPAPLETKEITQAQTEKEAISKAEAALEESDSAAKIKAILALRAYPSVAAVELLTSYLKDLEPAVVAEAIDTLGYFGLNSSNEVLKRQILDVLLDKADDKDFNARGSALITAAMLGQDERTFSSIENFVAEEGELGKEFAVKAMTFLASPACVPYLKEIIVQTQDYEISKNASVLLAKIGTPDALAVLSNELHSKKEAAQVSSAWALSRKSQTDTNALLVDAMAGEQLPEAALSVIATSAAASDVFGETLNLNIPASSKVYLLEVLSVYSINGSGSIRNEVAEVIKPLMESPDPEVKLAAIKAMGKIGAKNDHSEAIAENFESDSFLVRGAALESFIQYCSPKTYKPLKTLWYDKDEKIRRTAFFFSEAFLNLSDLEDLQKATEHSDGFIAKHSQLMIKHLTQVPR